MDLRLEPYDNKKLCEKSFVTRKVNLNPPSVRGWGLRVREEDKEDKVMEEYRDDFIQGRQKEKGVGEEFRLFFFFLYKTKLYY